MRAKHSYLHRTWNARIYASRQRRAFTITRPSRSKHQSPPLDPNIEDLICKPAWSVRALLPPAEKSRVDAAPAVSPEQLRHLLRLSALPAPKDRAEETRMLETLSAQLHFVKAIQQVDTTGVEPLRSLRDETSRGVQDHTYDMKSMSGALAQEEVVGRWHKRIRRTPHTDADNATKDAENWDALRGADRKVGRFFVVEGEAREG